jgi:hypothetical protein
MVRIRTDTFGLAAVIVEVAWMPDSSGSWRSMRTTSGVVAATTATASHAVPASPMSSRSGVASSRVRTPLRNSG